MTGLKCTNYMPEEFGFFNVTLRCMIHEAIMDVLYDIQCHYVILGIM